MPLVTLFSSMKAFEGHNAIIQHNALDNWRHLPDVTAILLGDDAGSGEAAHDQGFLHIPDIACSEYGTPRLDAMFATAQTASTTPFVSYINGDILLPFDFAETVRTVSRDFKQFLMIGERWDVDITERLSDDSSTCDTRTLLHTYKGTQHGPTGIDYFVFPTGMIDYLPEFYIGRPGWDLWLVWESKRRGIPIVDATAVLTVLHQNHGYLHVPKGNGLNWNSGPEASLHKEILKMYPDFDPWDGTIMHATHRLTSAGFQLAKAPPQNTKRAAIQASAILLDLRRRVTESYSD